MVILSSTVLQVFHVVFRPYYSIYCAKSNSDGVFYFSFVCFSLQQTRKEFDDFEKLFNRFLIESGPSVLWDKIRLLPEESVSYI